MTSGFNPLRSHVLHLCAMERIEIIEEPGRDFLSGTQILIQVHAATGRKAPSGHKLHIVQVVTEEEYAAAMHELGHYMHPRGLTLSGERTEHHIIIEEESAWEWAQENALLWTESMESLRRFCIRHLYAGGARARVEHYKRDDALRNGGPRPPHSTYTPRTFARTVGESFKDFLRRSKT